MIKKTSFFCGFATVLFTAAFASADDQQSIEKTFELYKKHLEACEIEKAFKYGAGTHPDVKGWENGELFEDFKQNEASMIAFCKSGGKYEYSYTIKSIRVNGELALVQYTDSLYRLDAAGSREEAFVDSNSVEVLKKTRGDWQIFIADY